MKVRWTPTAILIAALLALVGCGGGGSLVGFEDASVTIAFDAPTGMDVSEDFSGDREGTPDLNETSEETTHTPDCVDRDGDHYGSGNDCVNVDCDDTNAGITDQCYCDRVPNVRQGCLCRLGDAPLGCDLDTGLSRGAENACNLGQRNCEAVPGNPEIGQWSACRQWRPDFRGPTPFVGVVSQCPGSCSPECRHQIICPEAGDPIPAGSSNVVVANVAHAVFCPGGASIRGGITTTCTPAMGGSYSRGTSPLAWRDACAAPGHQNILTNSDDGTTVLGLPFTFRFYGSPFASLGIATNGMISFDSPTYISTNSTLPTGDVANTLFAFWDDVHNRTNGACIAVFGTAPNREYVVQWSDQYFAGSSTPASEHLTYQAVLTETSNTIDVLYNQMMGGTRAEGDGATVGLQQGTGSSTDLIGFNSPGVTPAGRTIRWTPLMGSTVCSAGTYTRVYEGTTCSGTDAPFWGQYNYSSIVPQGTSIKFRVRVSETSAGLASAPWIGTVANPLFRAPNGTPSMPTSVDVGALIRVHAPTLLGADHFQFMEVEATLTPSPDGTLAPTLISTEAQFTCATPEDVECRPGTECIISSDPCRVGRVDCINSTGGRPVETCVPNGNQPAGVPCGAGSVCNGSGVCVPCADGEACSTGQACSTGRISCATGVPMCEVASQLPVGTVCGGSTDVYMRTRPSPMPWIDVCALAGHQIFLVNGDDGVAGESLPFTFRFYGSPYAYAGLSSNGMMSFVMPTNAAINSMLPTTSVENTIFGFWDDLHQRGGICTATVGTAPLRRYIAEWEDNYFYTGGPPSAAEHVTFEISLSEGNNAVDVLYSQADGGPRATGDSATIGIQRLAGSSFDQVGYNTAGIASAGSSIRWAPGTPDVCDSMANCVPCNAGGDCTPSGLCAVGRIDCSSGIEVCVNIGTRSPTTETCNGVDDDCDGDIDEMVTQGCYTGGVGTSGVGACHGGVQTCTAGAWSTCAGEVTPGAETCNNIDDNCNGSIDETVTQGCYTGASGTSGVGVCRDGLATCTAGTWGSCTGQVLPSAETCNGLDDNCNGSTDETVTQGCYTGPTGTGGVGVCRAGTATCVAGAWGTCMSQVTPVTELCNGLDDDCNGAVDNGVARNCYTGPTGTRMVGRCADGIQACSVGTWGTCSGQVLPAVESCNNIDDDCDGTIDDGVAEACYTGPTGTEGVGQCRGGTRTCAGGLFGVVCPGEVVPVTEICNGLDDDCDGMIDEGLGTTTCGAGLCQRTVNNCVGGVVQVCMPGGSGAETCNGLDDDCDGMVDDGLSMACYTGTTGTDGVGLCHGGTLTCSAGTWGSCAGQVVPVAEVCNSLDDDCDGLTDETFPTLGSSCSAGVGACVRTGTIQCRSDGTGVQCSATAGTMGVEVCNNIDDDCDGMVDEGLTQSCYGGPPGSSGVGLCSAGTQTCGAGAWGTCVGAVLPTAEICNNQDDDCNGIIDNGVARSCYTGPTGTSGVGICRPGSEACSAGAWGTCMGQTLPGTEICNGVDDDCDGQVDDGATNTCAAPSDLGIVHLGGSVVQTTFMPGGSGEQWYQVTFPPDYDYNMHGVGTPTINLTGTEVASGALRMQVLVSGTAVADCSAAASCGMNLQSWQFIDNQSANGGGMPDGAYSTRNRVWPRTVLIRVYRPSGVGLGCGLYTLTISRCTCGMPGCSAPAGSLPAEVCDGIDNDCNGLIDEGFCRIGGVCYNDGTLNPANNCQVCTVPSTTAPGPTTWSNVASGIVCRVAAGVCDVAETCNGSGSACPADVFRSSSTVCRASSSVCDATETCTGSAAACPADSPVSPGTACNPPISGVCSGFTCGCPSGQLSCSGTCLPTGAACTVGIGACQRTGVVICGTGPKSTCSVMPGAPTPEVCDGIDNDCNGLIDEGFCRIGGVCFSNGTLNPANNCQVCTVPSSVVSGPTTWSNVAAGTVCRASAGVCDVAEVCAGSGAACPTNAFQSAVTVCRANNGLGCDVAETCTGSSAACPADSGAAAGTVCRAASGACDVAETCGGTSAACPTDGFQMAGTVCRAGNGGGCDVAESCTGSSAACPADVGAGVGTICRASAGPCDVAEVCGSTSSPCPADGFLPSSTVCRANNGLGCDVAETCTGTAAACPADVGVTTGTVCRASAGSCDVAETCNGSSTACPVDGFQPTTTVCRASAGVCDVAETCTGSSAACPVNGFQPSSSVCRADNGGGCDVAETCNGSSAACPADVAQAAGTVCRASAGVCDVQETCTGSSAPCPTNAFLPSSTVCRANNMGGCDVAETCTGSAAACPADNAVAAGTICRASAGSCDVAELCGGTSAPCAADGFLPSTTVCRPGNGGGCDVSESCTGSAAACPPDLGAGAGTVCRAAAGPCDVQEVCGSGSTPCPADVFLASSTVCRASAGVCDVAESCTGTAAACPTNVFVSSSTVCRASAGVCDLPEACTGSAAACPTDAFVSSITVCRASAGICDVAELCTGSTAACPTNAFLPSSSICRADNMGGCDIAEACTGSSATCPADSAVAAGTTCRASAGICDPAETCGGTSAMCPSNSFSPSTTVCRASAGVCDPAETCTGSTAACPGNSFSPSTTVCRAVAGVCDSAELCTGSTAPCPADVFLPSTTVCRMSNGGGCDVQEACTGSGAACPPDLGTGSGTICRIAAGPCDVAEMCGSTSAPCPVDGFLPSSTVCRAAADVCDAAESCTGSAASCPTNLFRPSSTVCRAVAGVCDVQETCTGSGIACPTDLFRPSSTVCRAAVDTTCDLTESCTGSAAACPPDVVRPMGTICRLTVNQPYCDPTEVCTGSSGFCPANTVIRTPVSETMVPGCNGIDDDCDGTVDNGTPTTCASPTVLGTVSAGGSLVRTTYMPSIGGQEQWFRVTFPPDYDYNMHGVGTPTINLTGTGVASGLLRMQVLTSASTSPNCLAAASCAMDLQSWQFTDNVSPSGGSPTGAFSTRDVVWPQTVLIRIYRPGGAAMCGDYTLTISRCSCGMPGCTAPVGSFPSEVCDGVDNDCDGLVDEGFCRIGGVCFTNGDLNPANNCQVCTSPTSAAGPSTWSNVAAGIVCRVSAGVCDVAETCNGTGSACPANVFAPSSTVCRANNGGGCDVPESCTGSAAACPTDLGVAAGTVCRAVAGVCDVAETCGGTSAACPTNGFVVAGTVCRADNGGGCDVAEACTGVAAGCPADGGRGGGTICRASAGVCDPAEACGSGSAPCPANVFATAATVCRASAGTCDPAELCTGSTAACPTDALSAAGTVCRASAGICDVAETCTGASVNCPTDVFASAATVCRAVAGVCDVAESCTGSGAACPSDGFQSAATVCRPDNGGGCDVAESCTGSGAACPSDSAVAAGTTCRASTGVCDPAETCGGTSAPCPGNSFSSSATVCRASAGVCDVAETCTGSTAACPSNGFQSPSTVCRTAAGICDAAETCTGSAATCPVDLYQPSGTMCRAVAGACDVAETCTGSAVTCPTDGFLSAATVCRPDNGGGCDLAESCTGSAAACPADGARAAGFVCRASAGICDVQEVCGGTSAACPGNSFLPATTVCRTSAGVCDVAESCTGSAAACPADSFQSSSTVCRAAVAGGCDVAESCTGSGAACPADVVATSGTICRAAAGVCDVQEVCTGSSNTCPTNVFTASGTVCRAVAAGGCDVAEVCTGSAAACPANAFSPSTTVCRAAVDATCDVAENCTGGAAACPTDIVRPMGTVCRMSTSQPYCDPAESCTGSSGFCPTNTITRAPTTEICDSIDNDCDGAVDENFTGSATACTTEANLSQGRTATLSAQYATVAQFGPQIAVDGLTSGFYTGITPSQLTIVDTSLGWWQVDLGASYQITRVVVFGRTDASPNQSQNFAIQTSSDGSTWSTAASVASAVPSSTSSFVRTARFVRLQRTTADYLSIAEVQVFGCPTPLGLACSVGIGACTSVGTQICASGGATTTCSATPGSPTAETCDGIDNDCDGLVDEGFCRIGGVCFNNGNLNPANNCQVCTVPSSTVSGPTTWANVAAGTTCRASAGVCDVVETCNGTGTACPADGFSSAATVCRADNLGGCDVAETCTGTSAACPADGGRAAGFVCRASAGVCDVAETCGGTSAACPGNSFQPSSFVCRASVAGGCDVAETCTGGSATCPADVVATSGTICRATTGVCDPAETCNGVSNACPANVLSGTSVICRASVGACDPQEVCTGLSGLCPGNTLTGAGVTCRASAGVCDPAEVCTGSSGLCPANVLSGTSTICRASTGVCDPQEVCTGSAVTCPANIFTTAGTTCRASAGACDPAEVCTGSSGLCPGNTLTGAGVTCRASAGACDPAEVCTGSSAACPADTLSGSSVTCRASAGVCDVAEVCTGASPACPGNAFQASSVTCRASAGGCDPAELCTGSSAACPGDTLTGAGTVCRASAGVCDPQEVCTGGSAACPGNTLYGTGTVCRASTGVCDPQEVCTGGSAACPANVFTTAGTTCRASVGACDPAEVCTGSSGLCPGNTLTGAGTICRASAGACDPQEVCNGSSGLCPGNTLTGAGTICRASTGACDPQEVCTGGSAACPTNVITGAGVVCRASAGACDPAETCNGSSGLCPGNTLTGAGVTCRSAAGICDVLEACTGSSPACPADVFLGTSTVCRPSVNVSYCDPAEVCTGSMAACPGNTVIRAPTTEVCDAIDNNCNGVVDDGSATTCGTAINLGTLSVGGTFTRTEWIPAPAGSEQWYVVSVPQSTDYAMHGAGTPQIRLTADPAVRFDVQSVCGTNLSCGSGGASTGRTFWSFADTISPSGAGAYTSRAVAWPTVLYIRVYRISSTTTCFNQTLSVTRPAGSAYQSGFDPSVTPNGTYACTSWNAFRANLDAARTYTSVTMSGSNNTTGRTCSGAAANTICQALRTGTATSVACGGTTWSVGDCYAGQVELNADALFCNCSSQWAVRPCHLDPNYGGVGGGSSCGQAYQTLQVNCQ